MPEENNVLVIHFAESSKAFEALSQLKGQPGVRGAAVVERTADGEVRPADGYSPEGGTGVAVGGSVGALIGILAGPVGVLLGWSTGMLAGMAYEADELADADDGFTILSQSIPAGGNALIVEITETSHAFADDVAARLDGTITRLPVGDVQAEIESAQKAARKAAAEARKVRRAERQRGVQGEAERPWTPPHHDLTSRLLPCRHRSRPEFTRRATPARRQAWPATQSWATWTAGGRRSTSSTSPATRPSRRHQRRCWTVPFAGCPGPPTIGSCGLATRRPWRSPGVAAAADRR